MGDFLLRGWAQPAGDAVEGGSGDRNNNNNNNNSNNQDATDGLLGSGLEFGSMSIQFRTPPRKKPEPDFGASPKGVDEIEEHEHADFSLEDPAFDNQRLALDDEVSSMGESVDEMVQNSGPRKLNPKSVEDIVRKSIIHMDGKNVEALVTKSIKKMDQRPQIKQQKKNLALESGSAEFQTALEKSSVHKDDVESQLTTDDNDDGANEIRLASTVESSEDASTASEQESTAAFSAIWNGMAGRGEATDEMAQVERKKLVAIQGRIKLLLYASIFIFLAAASVVVIGVLLQNFADEESEPATNSNNNNNEPVDDMTISGRPDLTATPSGGNQLLNGGPDVFVDPNGGRY